MTQKILVKVVSYSGNLNKDHQWHCRSLQKPPMTPGFDTSTINISFPLSPCQQKNMKRFWLIADRLYLLSRTIIKYVSVTIVTITWLPQHQELDTGAMLSFPLLSCGAAEEDSMSVSSGRARLAKLSTSTASWPLACSCVSSWLSVLADRSSVFSSSFFES